MWGVGFGVCGLQLRGLGFGVWGSWFGARGLGFGVEGVRVLGLGCRFQG